MAAWYAAPPQAGLTPLIPNQQSSLSGTRTVFACQEAIACTDGRSVGPSKSPQPRAPGDPLWMHLNSCPERLTPNRRTVLELASTRWLPTTRSESPPDDTTGAGLDTGAASTPGGASGCGAASSGAPASGVADCASAPSTGGATDEPASPFIAELPLEP